jgi:hypothetical protein
MDFGMLVSHCVSEGIFSLLGIQMPKKNINERYKNDPDFREKMKENSRKRYADMKRALALVKEMEATPPPAPAPAPSSSVVQSIPS